MKSKQIITSSTGGLLAKQNERKKTELVKYD